MLTYYSKFLYTILFVIGLVSCSKSQGTYTNVSVSAFEKLKKEKSGLVILDVRTPQEVAAGKIEGAVEIDFYNSDFIKQVNKLDKSKPVMVYCAVGGRSAQTMDLMKQQGFKEVYNLEGGIQAWQKAGKPLVKQ